MRQAMMAPRGAKPMGPYSHAVRCSGTLLFVSGQGPLDPASGEIIQEFRPALVQTLEYIKGIVEDAGATLADVVKVNAYLRDMADFATFNEVYQEFFPQPYPARTTVQSNMTIPVEIDVVAVLPEG